MPEKFQEGEESPKIPGISAMRKRRDPGILGRGFGGIFGEGIWEFCGRFGNFEQDSGIFGEIWDPPNSSQEGGKSPESSGNGGKERPENLGNLGVQEFREKLPKVF